MRHTRTVCVCSALVIGTIWGGLTAHAAEEESRRPAGEPGILLLRSGALIDGRILKAGENYTVHRPNGDMFVPGSMVRLHCETLGEIYKKLHDSAQRDDSGEARIALARWCITNKLLKEARQELTEACDCLPSRSEARDMLHTLDTTVDPPPEARKKAVDLTQSAPATPRFGPDEVESLGGLTRDQGQQFMRRIQPILVNNCAVGGCHSATSESGFRLQRVIPGNDTSRLASERNLAGILDQIDYDTPRQSPLLTVPDASHGRRGKSPFPGARGTEQLAELKKWVMEVSRSELGKSRRDAIAHQEKSKPGVVRHAGEHSEQSAETPSRRNRIRHAHAEEPADGAKSDGRNDPFGVRRSALGASSRDPFDAVEFNRDSLRRRP